MHVAFAHFGFVSSQLIMRSIAWNDSRRSSPSYEAEAFSRNATVPLTATEKPTRSKRKKSEIESPNAQQSSNVVPCWRHSSSAIETLSSGREIFRRGPPPNRFEGDSY